MAYLNCGQATGLGREGVRIEIWDGSETYQFRISVASLQDLLRDEVKKGVPVARAFGLLENPNYGRAFLSRSKEAVNLKFWGDGLHGRRFSILRWKLREVANWPGRVALVTEWIDDPIPAAGAIRMGAIRE